MAVNIGTLTAYLTADLKGLTTGLDRASRHIKRFGSSTGKILRGISHSFRVIGRFATKASIALGAAIGTSIKAFASFEEQLANVSTMLDEHTMKFIPKYAQELKKMAVEFGESTSTLSTGLYNILSASIPAAKAIDTLAVSAKAARAGLTDTSTAAYAITGILNAYGLAADKAGKISDILFSTVKSGQTTFAQLAPVIGRVTAISAEASVAFEEVAAALATVTRGGISTDEAVTGLRQAIITLQGRQKEAIKIAKQHGVELSVSALKAKGLKGMLEELGKLTPEIRKEIFSEIRARTALNVLIKDQTGFLRDYDRALNSAGQTQEAFAKMTDTLAHRFRQLWQAVKIVAVEVGERFAESMKELTEYIIENQKVIADWAVRIADRIIFVKDVFFDFLKLMQTDFQKGWQAVLKTFIESLELAAKIALNLAIRTGKGIWQGIREGIFGAQERAIHERALAEYRRLGGKLKLAARFPVVPGVVTPPAEIPADEKLFEELLRQEQAKAREKTVEGIMTGFREDMQRYLRDMKSDIKGSSAEVSDIIEKNLQKLYDKDTQRQIQNWWGQLKQAAQPTIESVKSLGASVKDLFYPKAKAEPTLPQQLSVLSDELEGVADKVFDVEAAYRHMFSEMGRMTEQSYQMQREILEKLKNEYLQHGMDKLTVEQWFNEQVRKLDIERLKASENILDGFRAAGKQIQNELKTWGEIGFDIANNIKDAFGDALYNMIEQGKSFKDVMVGFFKEVERAVIRIMAQTVAENIISGAAIPAISGIFGGLTKTSAATAVPVAHAGGIVGVDPMHIRMLSPSAFMGARRLHTGLQPDEEAVIMQRGETVIPKDKTVVPNVELEVNVINETGRPMTARRRPIQFDGKRMITEIVLQDINGYGPISNAIRNMP